MDFIVEDRKDFHFVPESYKLETFMKNRNNEDISLKKLKKELIQLCKASKLRVQKDKRTKGDLQGHFGHLEFRRCSTAGLVLAS